MPAPFEFDFKNPDYASVYNWRMERLERIRSNPGTVDILKEYYKDNLADFITHWGMTYDPRQVEIGLAPSIPFVLFDRQEEWIDFVIRKWRAQERGLTEKSRDMGVSWLVMALSCTLCLFHEGITIGVGSRKEDLVDKIGDPSTLFYKARFFMSNLPREFRGGFEEAKHAPYMRVIIPETESYITGEAGDNIGRGGRSSIYFVDEAAYIARAESIEGSLSNNTNCRMDVSSSNGMDNVFAQRRFSGKTEVFTFFWRNDPRKDDAWYEKFKIENTEVVVAREVDIDYTASAESIVIPGKWIQSSIGAANLLNIPLTGDTKGALDVADEGIDLNAFTVRRGIEIIDIRSWSGKGSDLLQTAEKAFFICDELECFQFDYDSDGLGASVRGDSNAINMRRTSNREKPVTVNAFRGSGEVANPKREMVKGRKNQDFFANRKAQAWWSLRLRFQETHRAVEAAKAGTAYDYNKDDIISLSPDLKELSKLVVELSQPTYSITTIGKILINKSPDGTRSPNLADSVMMVFAPSTQTFGFFS
jgi:phage terminase large subunit